MPYKHAPEHCGKAPPPSLASKSLCRTQRSKYRKNSYGTGRKFTGASSRTRL
jgi:hypothetical protein